MRRRFGVGSLVLMSVLVAPPALGAVEERPVLGRLTDGQGGGVAGAEVYLAAVAHPHRGAAGSPMLLAAPLGPGEGVAVLESDADGAVFTRLPPGRYRVAALKTGYDVAMTEVNTRARPVFKLEMRRSEKVRPGEAPVGAEDDILGTGWILRRRRGDVLRQENASLQGMGGREAAPEATRSQPKATKRIGPAEAIVAAVDGRFVQQWGGDGLLNEAGSAGAETVNRSTGLTLDGAIGERGRWSFDGWRGRSSAGAEDGTASVGRRSDRVAVGLAYGLTAADELQAEIAYDTGRYVVGRQGETIAATEQEERTVDLRSRWNRDLGERGTLFVDGAFTETGVRLPDPERSPLATLPDSDSRGEAYDRSWRAAAGATLQQGSHRLGFGLRAKRYECDLRDRGVLLRGSPESPTLLESGASGNAVSLFAGDRWRIGERADLDYGVGYHGNLSLGEAFVVPRIGMTQELSTDGTTVLRSALLFRLDDLDSSSGNASGARGVGTARPGAGRLGYMVGFERRPPGRLQLAATLSYRPFEEEVIGIEEGSLASQRGERLLLTDGAAATRELGLEVAHGFGGFHGRVAGRVGRVEGRVTPVVERAPVQILEAGEVRYYQTSINALYGPTETELQVDYQRVEASFDGATGPVASPADYRQLDLIVYQDLPAWNRLPGADLKVMMAYQGMTLGSLYDGAGGTLVAHASRLTGGLDISF